MVTIDVSFGYFLALLSLIFNGSFIVFFKIDRVKRTSISPYVYNFYVLLGVGLVCFVAYIILELLNVNYEFTMLGVISGMLVTNVLTLAWLTIDKIGISYGGSITNGVAVLTSFLEGLILGSSPKNMPLTCVSVFIIICGIFGISFSKQLRDRLLKAVAVAQMITSSETVPLLNTVPIDNATTTTTTTNTATYTSLDENENENENENEIQQNEIDYQNLSAKDMFIGFMYSLVAGICLGSMSLPTLYTTSKSSDIKFLPSVGAGILAGIVKVLVGFAIVNRKRLKEIVKNELFIRQCMFPGILSGVVFTLGLICNILAIVGITYKCATPIMDCALVISTLWGIILFREVTEKYHVLVLLGFMNLVIIGCILLSIYGI